MAAEGSGPFGHMSFLRTKAVTSPGFQLFGSLVPAFGTMVLARSDISLILHLFVRRFLNWLYQLSTVTKLGSYIYIFS